jgi:hypothetical protein
MGKGSARVGLSEVVWYILFVYMHLILYERLIKNGVHQKKTCARGGRGNEEECCMRVLCVCTDSCARSMYCNDALLLPHLLNF